MSRHIEYLADKDIVLVRTKGRYILESETETLTAAAEKLREHKCGKCVFDHRETDVIVGTMGAYERPEVYRTLGFDSTVYMAHVFKEITDNLKFYETVCVNRGWRVEIFDDYDAALNWLSKKKSFPR